ncbi:MAG: tripartite tricarboxylate transporter permease [Rhodospirillales bacterium]
MSPEHLLFLIVGVAVGLAVGILPGLGGIAGLSLVLPFLFGIEPGPALAMMIGLTSVTATSDTFPSVLMGIPGTSASQATVLDGFPLSQKGEAARALSAAFTASLFGGLFGALVLTGAIFVAKPIILAIGFGEQLMLVVLGITMVGMLTGESPAKGFASCCFGLLLGAIGEAFTTGQMRLGMGSIYLTDGLPLVLVGLGMFAVPEIVDLIRRNRTISESGKLGVGWLDGFKDAIRHKWIILRCSGIGCLVGALPGLGGSVVDWIAYGHIVQTSSDKSQFGKGDIRGVIAPESANNAKEGGALIPTLLFGIPGSGSMALLLGGLIVIGVEPGPNFVRNSPDLAFVIIWSIGLANVFGAGACLILAQPIAKLTTIRYSLIAPFMFCIIFFAAFQASNDWGDIIGLMIVGTLGIYMKRFGWSRPALLIGFVLSDRLELLIYQTHQAYGIGFLTRPIALFLFVLVLISAFIAFRSKHHGPAPETEPKHAPGNALPQVAFLAAVALIPIFAIYDSLERVFSMSLYPITIGLITFIPLTFIAYRLFFARDAHVVLYDAEKSIEPDAPKNLSAVHYILWLVGLVAGAALIGFVFAVAVFLFVFLMIKARTTVLAAAFGALVFVGLLALLGHFLVLEYPMGLLQDYVPMPWPFISA